MNSRRLLRIFIALLVVIILIGYPLISLFAYNTLSLPGAKQTATPNTPFEDVKFPSRGQNYLVSAYYIKSSADAQTLILVHGWKGSRHGRGEIERTQDLQKLGYNILSLDLTGSAGETVGIGRITMGYLERYDVLGAFDYLLGLGVPAQKIGLVGTSMGGATVILAAGLEPRLKAIWADSPFADPFVAVSEQTETFGFPRLIVPGGMLWSMMITGQRLWESRAVDQGAGLAQGKQALQLAHCVNDNFVFFHHSKDIQAAFLPLGVNVSLWSETCVTERSKIIHAVMFDDFHVVYLQRLDAFFKGNLARS